MSRFVIPGSGLALVALIVVVLVKADAALFHEDAAYSDLYDITLRDAYSRFATSNKKVAANGNVAELAGDPGSGPAVPAPANPQMMSPPRVPAAAGGAQGLGFGKQQSAMAALHGGAPAQQAGAQPHQHAYDDGGPHTRRGSELLAQRDYDGAIAEFQLALAERPDRALAQHSIGDALRYQGKHAEAIQAYEKTLAIKPSYYCCYQHMGDILKLQGLTAEAEGHYSRAEQGYRDDFAGGGPQSSIAAYNLAKFFLEQNRNLPEAITFAEAAVKSAPTQAAYLHMLARCYEGAGRRDDAVRTMDQLLSLNPENPQIYKAYRDQLAGVAAPGSPPKP